MKKPTNQTGKQASPPSGSSGARTPSQAGPERGKPKPTPLLSPRFRPAAPDPGPQATPREQMDFLAGQVQSLATRLEVLREQGAGHSAEFQQLERLLATVQDKLLLAQNKLERGG